MHEPLNLTSTANPFDAWFQPVEVLAGLSMIDHLYNRLDGAYPHKWRSNFPNEQAVDNWRISWAEAFEEEGITPKDIAAGLKACRSRFEWPPSCAEFIKACKPSVDPLVAYYEAVAGVGARAKGEMGTWSHPAIYWAAVGMAFDLGSQTYSQIKLRWERAYAEQIDRGEWDEIKIPTLALPAPGRGDLSKEKAKEMIEKLGAADILKPKSSDTFWLRKLQERIARGDKTITLIQRKYVEEAERNLGMIK